MYQFTVKIDTSDPVVANTARQLAIDSLFYTDIPTVLVSDPTVATTPPPAPALALSADELRKLTNYLAGVLEDYDDDAYDEICAALDIYGIDLPRRATTKTYTLSVEIDVTASPDEHATLADHIRSMLYTATVDALNFNGTCDHYVDVELNRID